MHCLLAACATSRAACGLSPITMMVPPAGMPARWAGIHDCERPSRWREALDEEDCKTWRLFSCATNPSAECEPFYGDNDSSKPVKKKYAELVPNINTMDDVVKANALAASRKKLVVIKFYSTQCRACLRIAAKYRRLALDFKSQLDCYEIADTAENRATFDALGVSQVPSVQIFRPNLGAEPVRLGKFSCMPKEWSKLDSKVHARTCRIHIAFGM